jgi:hypothetical protein
MTRGDLEHAVDNGFRVFSIVELQVLLTNMLANILFRG